MFKHLFTLIWNKKKRNLLMLAEMLISFLVIFALFTLVVFYYTNYRKPLGFEYENVWVVSFSNPPNTNNMDSVKLMYDGLKQSLKSLPETREISFCSGNIPFYNNQWETSARYNGKNVNHVNIYTVDDNYKNLMKLQLLEGRWFERGDEIFKDRPVIINESLKKEFFGNESPIGKYLGDILGGNRTKIIGVVGSVKARGDYTMPGLGMYQQIDTGSYRWLDRMMVKVSPRADAAFEGHLYKTLASVLKNSNIEIEHLVDKRRTINYFTLVPMIVSLIVAIFLIINVALGLFGVLWYNINKRKGEIGIRRAIGASGKSVSVQLVSESMILATLSLIIGTFFAMQFPLLNVFDLPTSVYITAIVLSIIFIYLLVFICSLYPGKQAASIYPAVALHEE